MFELSQEEGEFLLRVARRTVEEYIKTGNVIEIKEKTSPKLEQLHGVFVTINSYDDNERKLRGCIGYPYPTAKLTRAVVECSISAATQDPRFRPISKNELREIVFEISVLTKPRQVEVEHPKHLPSKIEIGKDGLIVEKGFHKGLLLPQVPVEWNWDSEEFLCQSCLKAGLPPDCWLTEKTKIHKFSCIIIRETAPNGTIEVIDMRKLERV